MADTKRRSIDPRGWLLFLLGLLFGAGGMALYNPSVPGDEPLPVAKPVPESAIERWKGEASFDVPADGLRVRCSAPAGSMETEESSYLKVEIDLSDLSCETPELTHRIGDELLMRDRYPVLGLELVSSEREREQYHLSDQLLLFSSRARLHPVALERGSSKIQVKTTIKKYQWEYQHEKTSVPGIGDAISLEILLKERESPSP